MRVGVLGSGIVGRAVASRLAELGHDVRMGSRDAGGPAAEWASQEEVERASAGDYREAADFGELIVNATAGGGSLPALRQAGANKLEGKVLLDIANPIELGGEGTLSVANTDSLAEQIQREFPAALVVKSLNTMNCQVMVHPGIVPGDHVVFVSSDHDAAKQAVREILVSFGWPTDRIVDLGALSTSRGTEALLLLWLPTWRKLEGAQFNWGIHKAAD